ncbi:hypothetical protein PC128_g3044 [Phytophthora cactorum]|nr:hypothetical protein PC128_g3044 [Phytophthora cactorum]
MTEDEVDIDMNTIVGFGGDAKIYRGELKDGTLVAVKIFNDDMKKTNEAKQKFFNTMKLWERLSHRNICRLHGACYFTMRPFVVMEYCDVGPLDKFLRDHESNRCQLGLEILVQAAQAFVKMHSIGIVHGDIKCDNILVTGSNRQAKICDFDRSFDWISLKHKRLVKGTAGDPGSGNERLSARFINANAIALNPDDDLFILDGRQRKILKITGDNTSTFASFNTLSEYLNDITVDFSGNVYLTDGQSNSIFKMDSFGNISTFVYINKSDGAQFNPVGVAVDSADNVYTTDWNRVLKFTQNGTMTVVAGTETYGYADGVGEAAVFCLPKSLTVGSDGDLYVADTYNNCIRKISLTTNAVTT